MITISIAKTSKVIDRLPVGIKTSSIQSSIHTYPDRQADDVLKLALEKIKEGYSVLLSHDKDN